MTNSRQKIWKIARIPIAATGGYYLYNNWRKLYTRSVCFLSTRPIPRKFRRQIFTTFIKCVGVDANDILDPLESFSTFQDFFIRRVHPREVRRLPGEIYSPCDAYVTEIRRIEADEPIKMKNVVYSLKKLMQGEEGSLNADELRLHLQSDEESLFAVSFYLSPGDYHRFHAPDDLRVDSLTHIPGGAHSVNPFRQNVRVQLDGNERVILDGAGRLGRLKMAFVAALGVGGIEVLGQRDFAQTPVQLAAGQQLRAGEELGMFLLGSSIFLLFSAPKGFQFNIAEGDKVRYGQPLGSCHRF